MAIPAAVVAFSRANRVGCCCSCMVTSGLFMHSPKLLGFVSRVASEAACLALDTTRTSGYLRLHEQPGVTMPWQLSVAAFRGSVSGSVMWQRLRSRMRIRIRIRIRLRTRIRMRLRMRIRLRTRIRMRLRMRLRKRMLLRFSVSSSPAFWAAPGGPGVAPSEWSLVGGLGGSDHADGAPAACKSLLKRDGRGARHFFAAKREPGTEPGRHLCGGAARPEGLAGTNADPAPRRGAPFSCPDAASDVDQVAVAAPGVVAAAAASPDAATDPGFPRS